MKQADLGLNLSTKRTRKREFLEQMDRVVPWAALVELVSPYAPDGRRGRPPFPVETMLRIHFMQQWFTLSDPAMEESLHDVPLFREFAQLDNWDTRLPDETTILRFRRLLERHKLAEQILGVINDLLREKGLLLRTGTVVDATLIAAPSSTKNSKGERDPEMHQSKKGNQWYFGMKAHIGVDAESGLVHTVRGTSGNVSDVVEGNSLLHGEETEAWGDAGYQGAHKRPDAKGNVRWNVAMRPGKRAKLDPESKVDQLVNQLEKLKASIRAKVEHPFRVIKRQFGHVKVRYRGLKKNTAQLFTLFALSNLWMVRHKLMEAQA
jgi:IS5 family transposase